MSWFDSSGWANMAKTALSSAQKTIDQALDINDSAPSNRSSSRWKLSNKSKDETGDAFFSSFGVGNLLSGSKSSTKKKDDATDSRYESGEHTIEDDETVSKPSPSKSTSDVTEEVSPMKLKSSEMQEEHVALATESKTDNKLASVSSSLSPILNLSGESGSEFNTGVSSAPEESRAEQKLETAVLQNEDVSVCDETDVLRDDVDRTKRDESAVALDDNSPSAVCKQNESYCPVLDVQGILDSARDECEGGQWDVNFEMSDSTLDLSVSNAEEVNAGKDPSDCVSNTTGICKPQTCFSDAVQSECFDSVAVQTDTVDFSSSTNSDADRTGSSVIDCGKLSLVCSDGENKQPTDLPTEETSETIIADEVKILRAEENITIDNSRFSIDQVSNAESYEQHDSIGGDEYISQDESIDDYTANVKFSFESVLAPGDEEPLTVSDERDTSCDENVQGSDNIEVCKREDNLVYDSNVATMESDVVIDKNSASCSIPEKECVDDECLEDADSVSVTDNVNSGCDEVGLISDLNETSECDTTGNQIHTDSGDVKTIVLDIPSSKENDSDSLVVDDSSILKPDEIANDDRAAEVVDDRVSEEVVANDDNFVVKPNDSEILQSMAVDAESYVEISSEDCLNVDEILPSAIQDTYSEYVDVTASQVTCEISQGDRLSSSEDDKYRDLESAAVFREKPQSKDSTVSGITDPNNDESARVTSESAVEVSDESFVDSNSICSTSKQEDSEIQTSSDTLVLSEEDSFEISNKMKSSADESRLNSQLIIDVTHFDSGDILQSNYDGPTSSDSYITTINLPGEISGVSSSNTSIILIADDKSAVDLTSVSGKIDFVADVEKSNETSPVSGNVRSEESDDSSGHHVRSDENDERSDSSSSSISSFVKCGSADNQMVKFVPSSSSSSDIVKVDGGFTSGQTSGDDIETTSSDIEIISSPNFSDSLSGGNSRSSLSPTKQTSSLLKESRLEGSKVKRHTVSYLVVGDDHFACRYTSANKCMSSDGKNSSSFYPSFSSTAKATDEGMRIRTISDTSSDEAEGSSSNLNLVKKLSEMEKIIEARESKLLEVSRENVFLKETNSDLQDQLDHTKQFSSSDSATVDKITDEFTQRLSAMEKKLQQAVKEKADLDRRLELAQEEMSVRLCAAEVESLLQEKDEQIKELLTEGEKLSKQQLQQSNVIKKLRSKDKESEDKLKKSMEKLEEQTKQLEMFKKDLSAKGETEKIQSDSLKQLSASVQQLNKDLIKSKNELEDMEEKNASLKSLLENSYKEVAELHKKVLTVDAKVSEVKLSSEMAMKEEARQMAEELQREGINEKQSLTSQIEELQLSIARTEKNSSCREEMLRQEIVDLQERLRAADERNDDISQNISAATRPLLRQIENLQATFTTQSKTWEVVEKNLNDRLLEAQRQLSSATETEKIATEKYMDISSRLSSLESQNSSLIHEKARSSAALNSEKTKITKMEEAYSVSKVEMENVIKSLEDGMASLKRNNTQLELDLNSFKGKYETEKKSSEYFQEQLKEREKSASIILSESSNRSSGTNTPISTSHFSFNSDNFGAQEDILRHSLMSLSGSQINKMSVYDCIRSGNGTSSLLENLQSHLKQREGEIMHLQSDMSNIERIRESMSSEIVRLSTKNEQLEKSLDEYKEILDTFKDIESKYNAMLQMYGEKVEESNELRLDLQDVKDMYRAQIDQLLKQNS